MAGGSLTLGVTATRPGQGYEQFRAFAAMALDGRSVIVTGGTLIKMGATAGNNQVGDGVMALADNGGSRAATVNVAGITITWYQTGYAQSLTGRYLLSWGTVAALSASCATQRTCPTHALQASRQPSARSATSHRPSRACGCLSPQPCSRHCHAVRAACA